MNTTTILGTRLYIMWDLGHIASDTSAREAIYTRGYLQVEQVFRCVHMLSVREGTFFLGGGGLGNFGIFSKKSVGPPLRFNKKLLTPHL